MLQKTYVSRWSMISSSIDYYPREALASLGFYVRYLMRRVNLTGFYMKIKQGDVWRTGTLYIKRDGSWKVSSGNLVKVGGSYKSISSPNQSGGLYKGVLTIGAFSFQGNSSYGYSLGFFGSINPGSLSNGIVIQGIASETLTHNGAPPHRGLTVTLRDVIDGHPSFQGLSPDTIKLNGMVGQKIYENRFGDVGNLVITYLFPTNIPTSGVWNIEW